MQITLGEFIRARRERITPADVGLPGGGRRRTPGLRREELAQLCDVSPTWLTWLEQGRPVAASARMLGRLADVLHLSGAERSYLFGLADKLDPRHDAEQNTQYDSLRQELAAIVEAIDAPAYMLDRQWNAVAWNGGAAGLFGNWLVLERELEPELESDSGPDSASASDSDREPGPAQGATSPPNLLRYMFADAAARSLIADWPDRAARLVAEFRADAGRHAEQPPLAGLIAQLARDSAEFRSLWTLQNVVSREGGLRRFVHPQRGPLQFEQVTLHLAQRHDIKLVLLLPALPALLAAPAPPADTGRDPLL